MLSASAPKRERGGRQAEGRAQPDRALPEGLIDAIAEGVAVRSLKDELLGLESRREELEAALAAARALIDPGLAEAYRRRVTELHEALERQPDDPELIEAIRSLVDQIVLTPEGGTLRIDFEGDLEGIYEVSALAAKQKPAAEFSRRA